MIDRLLQSHLEPIARDSYRWRLWRGLATCWAALGLIGLVPWLLQRSQGWSSPFTFFILLVAAIAAAVLVTRHYRQTSPDYRAIARQIEDENPELHALLLTAVEQVPSQPSGELNYLQQRVILEALEHHRRSPWAEGMARRNQAARSAHWLTLLLFIVMLVGLRPHFSFSNHGGGLWASADHSNGIAVTPGDTSLERGSPLVVLARFDGQLPAEAELVVSPVNENERRVPLAKNLADPVYGGGLTDVKGDLKYRVEYPGGKTRDFKVSVFDYPKLDHADAKITYPAYTSLPEKTIKDTRRVSAVEGSSLDYSFFLNKPVVSAKLVAKDQTAVALTADTNNATVYHTQFKLDQSRRYELVLVDDAGRTNKMPPEFVLDALKNRPAELKLAAPRGDQRVSPLEEITFAGEASDDYGLRSYGIAYALADGETKTIELGQKSAPREKRALNYVLPLESLGAQPDQLLSYYLWADDSGPDGEVRRVTSDMYFAEIKPFDEIFREAQSPDAGGDQNDNNNNNNNQGGQQGGQNEQLTESEKQIISATWNLKRRETESKPSDKFKDDIKVIHDAQEEALDKVRQQAEQNEDPRLKTFVDTAQKQMEQAATHLAEAADKNSTTPLSSAVTEEQSAYQALLKLSAREYQVTRANRNQQQRGQQQQQRGQRAQRQLDQLDLRQTDNRYETQRDAASQQNTPEQREQLQVASRLKELAQRQQDLNERLRELQASLQEARTEQERQDIQDRLKTLREQQQDLLSDVDELRQRMDQPQNQQRMSDERQQLEQTRSEVQNAAESLAQNAVPEALSSGTRAQRDLQQLQDDFRKKNSGQFSDAVRQMRDNARQLAQNQEDIEKKLNDMSAPNQRTLTETDEQRKQRSELADRLDQQKNGVTNLLSNMRQVSEQSETAEPVLSQQLYDTVRSTSEDDLNKALDSSSELVRRGFVPQAGPFEERARQNIDDLNRHVEHAAESVLGDGTEALRLAQRELDDLTRQLTQGTAPGGDTNNAPGRGTNGVNQLAANQPGGQRNGQANRGGNRQGQRQDGQPDANGNDNQPGQDQNQQANAGNGQRDGQGQEQPGQGGNRRGQQRGGGNRQGQPQDGQQAANGQPGQDQSQDANADGGQRDGQPGQRGQGGNRAGQRGNGGNRQGQPGNGGQFAGGDDAQSDSNAVEQLMQQRVREARAGDTNGAVGGIARADGARNGGAFNNGAGGVWDGGYWDPIVGEDYVDWSDRLRVVEEMIDVPDLSTEVARIRDRARALRLDYKHLGQKPDWAVVTTQISQPLAEVRARVAEELLKRQSKDALVPLDRDPVPTQFSELVRRYYEQLGKSDQ